MKFFSFLLIAWCLEVILTEKVTIQLIQKLFKYHDSNCVNFSFINWARGYDQYFENAIKQNPQLKVVQQKGRKYSQQSLDSKESRQINSDIHFHTTPITQQQVIFADQLRTLIKNPNNMELISQQYKYYESKYQISKYDELPFCVVVTSYNNMKEKVYQRNIISILQQNYTNYHAVYIDDASSDGTFKAVSQFLSTHPLKNKFTLVQNPKNLGVPYNFIKAAKEYCKNNDIFFRVDGDDEMIGKQSLKLFNAIYQKYDSWVVYTPAIENRCSFTTSTYTPFYSNVIRNNDYRYSSGYPFFGQTSYYNQLLLRIKDSDLRVKKTGGYYMHSGDVTIAWPILQMAGNQKITFIPQLAYYYNINVGEHHLTSSQTAQHQGHNFAECRLRPKYQTLKQLFSQQNKPTKTKPLNSQIGEQNEQQY